MRVEVKKNQDARQEKQKKAEAMKIELGIVNSKVLMEDRTRMKLRKQELKVNRENLVKQLQELDI